MTSRSAIAALVALAATGALLLTAPAAPAQTPDRGLFGIAPAKVLLETRPPRDIRPLQLTNTTRLTYDVRIFAAPLRPAADGGLTYDASPEGRALGRRTIKLAATRYTMPPDSRRDLGLRWLRTFPGQRVAPMGIVVQGTPRGAAQENLSSIYRLVGTYLLQLPGGRRDGDFARLTAEQGPKRSLKFTAVVRNRGEVYDEPRDGRLTVRDQRGRAVARGTFKGELLLPGTERPFTVTIDKVLKAGRYTATATMQFAGRKRRIAQPFRLTGPNELPTTKLEIADLQGVGYVDEPARVKVRVRNSGTTTATAEVVARLDPGGDERKSPPRRLAAGEEATFELELGDLDKRDYDITTTANVGGKTFDSANISITPRPERSWWSRFKRWLSEHAVLAVVLLALLALAAMAAVMWRYRRRVHAQLAAGAGAGAGAGPVTVPPPAAGIDLNTATAGQLEEIPGIGPKSAERIVQWREEYGRFGALADLQRVEGFGAHRVSELERHLHVR